MKKYKGLSDFLRNASEKEKIAVFTEAAREGWLKQELLLEASTYECK